MARSIRHKILPVHTTRLTAEGTSESAPANPLQRPLRLATHRWHGLYRMEQAVLLRAVLDICLQQQAVHLCVVGDVSTEAPNRGAVRFVQRRHIFQVTEPSANPQACSQLYFIITYCVAAGQCGMAPCTIECTSVKPVLYESGAIAWLSSAAPEWIFSIAIWKP